MNAGQTNLLNKVEELRQYCLDNITDAKGELHAKINDLESRLNGLLSAQWQDEEQPIGRGSGSNGGSSSGPEEPLHVSGRETVLSDPDLPGQPGTGNGAGTESGSGFKTVETLEIEGGVIKSGDVVEQKDSKTRMTVIGLRVSDAEAKEVACTWFVGDERKEDSFAGSALRKVQSE